MHIILDSNIYAADYKMAGVSFRTLFEYLRRTGSRLVLPRVIREEVVLDYGRRLKSEAKEFAEIWNRYRHVDLQENRGIFLKPDTGYAMKKLRRRLMKPTEGVVPLYVPETRGVSIDEVFMRGVHRTRPANQDGEELRDVIIWLWVLGYSDSFGDQVAFVSKDSGFWIKDGIHPDIGREQRLKDGKVNIYRSIDDFAKQHAPAPSPATDEWLRAHFHVQDVERQLIDLVSDSLRLRGAVRDLALERHEFLEGSVYDVGPKTQFAELRFKLIFKFVYLERTPQTFMTSGWGSSNLGMVAPTFEGGYLNNLNRIRNFKDLQPDDSGFIGNYATVQAESSPRELHCEAEAKISVRIKEGESSEISVDRLVVDKWKLQADLYSNKSK
jgi:PIN domain